MQISDVMSDDVRFVEANDTIRSAIDALREADVRHIPVLDRGELVGIVSDRDMRDLTSRLVQEADPPIRPEKRSVSDIMQSNVHSVTPDDELVEAIDLMVEHRVGAIPVVDLSTRELVGIVSYVDVLRALRDRA